MSAAFALCKCGHPLSQHSEHDDVPCEGDHFRPPGSFVPCECQGFAEDSTSRVLNAIASLQDAAVGTECEWHVQALVDALAADTTAVELRQEIEFLKAELGGHHESEQ